MNLYLAKKCKKCLACFLGKYSQQMSVPKTRSQWTIDKVKWELAQKKNR